jgi:signal transduction histidine kinase
VAHNIKPFWQVLQASQRHLDAVALLMSEHLHPGGNEPESRELDEFARKWKVDVATVLSPDAMVIARRSGVWAGDVLSIPGVPNPIPEQFSISGVMELSSAAVAREGDMARQRMIAPNENALLVFSLRRTSQKAYFVAKVLNGAADLVDDVQEVTFGTEAYRGKRLGTVTLFMGRTRIATTVLDEKGNRATGTLVSDEVARQTLEQGVSWTGRAMVLNDWYLSRYDPLRDPGGRIIGMIYVGELERPFIDIKHKTIAVNVAIILSLMMLAILATFLIGERSLKQIAELRRVTSRFAEGDLSARVDLRADDETGALAEAFNRMADCIEVDRASIIEQKNDMERTNSDYMEMLGFVTHELRSTVSAALFNTHLLKDGAYGDLDDDQRMGLDLIQDSLNHLEDLTQNYLQLSRIEKGELLLNKVEVHLLSEVIQPVLDGFQANIQAHNMRAEVRVDPDLVIPADAGLLRVVYENLVGNAVRYGRSGGTVLLEAEEKDSVVTLSVWNEGKGLEETQMAALFHKFHRCSSEMEDGARGAGLGLFIVRQIVAIHGGQIWAESQPEQGARFSFTVPL